MSAIVADRDFPRDIHVGLVTDTIEETTRWFAQLLGVAAPAVGLTPEPAVACAQYLGQASAQRCRQSYLQLETIAFEFLTPDEQPGVWRDWLDRHGPGVHHIGLAVRDLAASGDAFEADGFPLIQHASFPGGRYAFPDTEAKVGVMIELLQFDRYAGR